MHDFQGMTLTIENKLFESDMINFDEIEFLISGNSSNHDFPSKSTGMPQIYGCVYVCLSVSVHALAILARVNSRSIELIHFKFYRTKFTLQNRGSPIFKHIGSLLKISCTIYASLLAISVIKTSIDWSYLDDNITVRLLKVDYRSHPPTHNNSPPYISSLNFFDPHISWNNYPSTNCNNWHSYPFTILHECFPIGNGSTLYLW